MRSSASCDVVMTLAAAVLLTSCSSPSASARSEADPAPVRNTGNESAGGTHQAGATADGRGTAQGRRPGDGEDAAEQQAAADAADSDSGGRDTADIAAADRRKLFACWLADPYPYMFRGAGGGGKSATRYGTFMAGISGILYYGHLNECAASLSGSEARTYSDNEPFVALSGLPIYSDRMNDDRPFGFYNPELIEWGRRNLIPDPDTTIAGVRAQALYDGIFSRFFRMMTAAHDHVVDEADFEQHKDAYWEMAEAGDANGIDWLHSRYEGALQDYRSRRNGTYMTPPMAIGFWLRRGIDGTEDELWKGLRQVMKRYDADWLASLGQNGARAAP